MNEYYKNVNGKAKIQKKAGKGWAGFVVWPKKQSKTWPCSNGGCATQEQLSPWKLLQR